MSKNPQKDVINLFIKALNKHKRDQARKSKEFDKLINDFIERRQNPPKYINNSSLYAGSPMYFYCNHCQHVSDVLPESYTSRPRHICHSCRELEKLELLEDAKLEYKSLL